MFILVAAAASICLQTSNGPAAPKKEKKVLVFAKTNGYHHESIAEGIVAIMKLGQENHFAVDSTTDSLLISDANLKKYSVIVFLSTTGKVLGDDQEKPYRILFTKAVGLWAFMRRPIVNTTGPGTTSWWAAGLRAIPNSSRPN